jgi:hypothetical protein
METTMFLIIAAGFVAGAFVIVATAVAAPISPWQEHIGAQRRVNSVLPGACAKSQS